MVADTPGSGHHEVVVALLGGAGIAEALAGRVRVPVIPTRPEDHLARAEHEAARGALVVGMSVTPWPAHAELHARASAELPAYTGVVSWHALPALLDRLAQAVAPGARGGAHVLVTAPDPGPHLAHDEAAFLPQVAEGISGRVGLPHRSIAWRGSTRQPTALDALTSLVEAHDRRDIVEVPVAPGTTADPALLEAAERLGARLTCVDLGRATQLDLLAEVVRTVIAHETEPGTEQPGGGSGP